MRENNQIIVSGRGRAERRKRRQRRCRRIFCFSVCAALTGMFFYMRDIQKQQDQLQKIVKQMEHSQNEEDYTGKEAEPAGHGHSLAVFQVGKPVDYTRNEALQQLAKMGEDSDAVREICENASQYPDNLLIALANNPEMIDFAAGYLDGDEGGSPELTKEEMAQDFPLFLQWDPRWGYHKYGTGSNIGLSGCGPTCLSMVLYSLTKDESLTPDKVAEYSMANGYYVEGTGTAWALMEDMPGRYGVEVSNSVLDEMSMKAQLDRGKIMICAMSAGDFTVSGHFIVIYGYDEEGFLVNDPNCMARSRKSWPFRKLKKQMKSMWSYGKSSYGVFQGDIVTEIDRL